MALMAGFKHSSGEIIITLDGDLQDNPEDIPNLITKLHEGFEVVNGWRQNRQDTFTRKVGSKLYNYVVGRFTKLYLHDHNCGMKAFTKEAAKSICIYGQFHRYIPLQLHLLGFRVSEEKITNSQRKYGSSKYNTFRYEGLFDLFSMMFLYRFGARPLHFFGLLSILFAMPSFGLLVYWTIEHLLWMFGFGEEFQFYPRPLLFIALTGLMISCISFITGFICDFVLHHLVRGNMQRLIELNTKTSTKP